MADHIILPAVAENLDAIVNRKNTIVSQVESILPAEKIVRGTRRFEQKLEEIKQILQDCTLMNTELSQISPTEHVFHKIGDVIRCENISVDYARNTSSSDILTIVPQNDLHHTNSVTGCIDQPSARSSSQETSKSSDDAVIAAVSPAEFESIPKYLRGRMTHNELNEVVSKFNEFLSMKRSLLNAPSKKLRKEEKDLIWKWKEQEIPTVAGQLYCQEVDIKPSLRIRTQALFRMVVPCLRYIHRIKEVREKGRVYYLPYS